MRKILLLVAIVLLLQGCVAAVLATGAVAVASGAIIADNRAPKTIVEDRNISYKVQAKLVNDQELKGKVNVSVATFNGVVLLVGQAPTAQLRDRVISITNSVPKIRLVHDEIVVGPVTSKTTRAHDSWITTKVKSALVAEQGLHSTQMKIVTENSIVYLLGLTTKGQGDLAAQKASQVTGVQKVVKLFEYIQ